MCVCAVCELSAHERDIHSHTHACEHMHIAYAHTGAIFACAESACIQVVVVVYFPTLTRRPGVHRWGTWRAGGQASVRGNKTVHAHTHTHACGLQRTHAMCPACSCRAHIYGSAMSSGPVPAGCRSAHTGAPQHVRNKYNFSPDSQPRMDILLLHFWRSAAACSYADVSAFAMNCANCVRGACELAA